MLLLACSLPEAANAAGKMPLCADWGVGACLPLVAANAAWGS